MYENEKIWKWVKNDDNNRRRNKQTLDIYLNLLEQNIGILNYEDDKEKSRMIMYRLSVDEFVCNVCEYVYVWVCMWYMIYTDIARVIAYE